MKRQPACARAVREIVLSHRAALFAACDSRAGILFSAQESSSQAQRRPADTLTRRSLDPAWRCAKRSPRLARKANASSQDFSPREMPKRLRR